MSIWNKYRSVWLFILRFFIVYGIGIWLYQLYLAQFDGGLDRFTEIITEQVADVFSIHFDGISTQYCSSCTTSQIKYHDFLVLTLIEGCNAVSVMILFVAFIIAFKGPLKAYLWFLPAGVALIYFTNLLRLYLLGIINIYYYKFSGTFHDYIFPLIIYGMVFILWIIWVKYIVHAGKE